MMLHLVLILYAAYMATACFCLSRPHWTMRSITVRHNDWLGWPAVALMLLCVPTSFLYIAIAPGGGFPPGKDPLAAAVVVCLHLSSSFAILYCTMLGQGYRPKQHGSAPWDLVLPLAFVPATGLLFWLGVSHFTPVKHYLGLLWDLAWYSLIIPATYGQMVFRLALGPRSRTELPPSPLASELSVVGKASRKRGDAQLPGIRLGSANFRAAESSAFREALSRSLRWVEGAHPGGDIPVEFVLNLPGDSLTAGVAVSAHGLEKGYAMWITAAPSSDCARSIPSFFRALAEFDRFLLQPIDTTRLATFYENSWPLRRLAGQYGSYESYMQALRGVREVLLDQKAEAPDDIMFRIADSE